MVVNESKPKSSNIMDGIENTGDVRMHDHRLRLKQRFDIVRKLGQGTYGKVQLGINKKTGQEVAIKTIKKCKIETEADLIRIRREVQIMSSVRHPNIVHIYEVFENSEKMILVMEYCPGGELYDYLSQQKVLQEEEARRIFRQIATAVYYCHIHKICHRDLKLENVLLDETGSAKIADFGLSNVFKETSVLSTFCGSPLYASPEIVKGTPYIGPEVDCWSLGVLLYTLVYGAMPFDGSNFKRLVKQISNGDYFEPKNPSGASSLIRDMLTVDPLKRADIAYICDHPWVNVGCSESCLSMAQNLASQTPVRLDLLLSLAPPPPAPGKLLVPPDVETTDENSTTELNSSMSVEPSNSAERRILELVAEGGADAIKPSPTRVLVGGDNKRRLASSTADLARKKPDTCDENKKEKEAVPPKTPVNETDKNTPTEETNIEPMQPEERPTENNKDEPSEVSEPVKEKSVKKLPKDETNKSSSRLPEAKVTVKKKITPVKVVTEEKQENSKPLHRENKSEEPKSHENIVSEKLHGLSIKPQPETAPAVANKRKSHSEEQVRPESVRLQNIGVHPPGSITSSDSGSSDLSLQDARKTLQRSMAALTGEQRRRARDTITNALANTTRGPKPPMSYGASGRSASANLTLEPKSFRTEAIHRIPDMRGASIERVIPIELSDEVSAPSSPVPIVSSPTPTVGSRSRTPSIPATPVTLSRRSSECSGEPIRKSAREVIIPIAVEGVGFVTPDVNATANKPLRRISLVSAGESEDENDDRHNMHRLRRGRGGLAARATAASPAATRDTHEDGGSSGDDDDDTFQLLTADNLFSTLLHRVRALTQKLNNDDGPAFPHHRNLFENFNSPFFERRGDLRSRLNAGKHAENLESIDGGDCSEILPQGLLGRLPPRAARSLARTLSAAAAAAQQQQLSAAGTSATTPRTSRLMRPRSYPTSQAMAASSLTPSSIVAMEPPPTDVSVTFNVNLPLKKPNKHGNDEPVHVNKKTHKKATQKLKPEMQTSKGENKESEESIKEAHQTKVKANKTKKKSMLQSLGQKLERFASSNSKSTSPETNTGDTALNNNNTLGRSKLKLPRNHRETSVPIKREHNPESGQIKRAVTLTNVSDQNEQKSKRTVSKMFGLFKKNDKNVKLPIPTIKHEEQEEDSSKVEIKKLLEAQEPETKENGDDLNHTRSDFNQKNDNPIQTRSISPNKNLNRDDYSHKSRLLTPNRPTSLLLNGLGRRKYTGATSDSILTSTITEISPTETDNYNCIQNNIRLDNSRLPRFQTTLCQSKSYEDKNDPTKLSYGNLNQNTNTLSKILSRSSYLDGDPQTDKSRTNGYSNDGSKSISDRSDLNLSQYRPQRTIEATTPDKEDILDRIRRKSYYNRFNEQKLRRKSNLVGPGATEYNPLSRIHPEKYERSPTSPIEPSSTPRILAYSGAGSDYGLTRYGGYRSLERGAGGAVRRYDSLCRRRPPQTDDDTDAFLERIRERRRIANAGFSDRSSIPFKSQGDSTERFEKID